MKIKVTQQQRDNALEALNVMWPSVPPENVVLNLSQWRTTPDGKVDCGTIACFGGWCATWPGFKKHGVYSSDLGVPCMKDEIGFGVAYALFGHFDIFDERLEHPADDRFKGTDHELVTHRLKWLIKNSEVV